MLGGFLTSNSGGFESFKLWTSHDPGPKPMDFIGFSSSYLFILFILNHKRPFRGTLHFQTTGPTAQLLEQDAQFVTGKLDILSFNALLGVCRQASRWEEAHRSNEKSCGKL